jgi:hypothetical protein
MRASFVALAIALGLVAACAHPAAVVVDDASAVRTPDGHVQVDILVTGVEEADGRIGTYCVSAHWFGLVDPNVTDPAPTYPGELDVANVCFTGLGDGDRRTVRVTSNKANTDLPAGSPIRCQVLTGDVIRDKDISNP